MKHISAHILHFLTKKWSHDLSPINILERRVCQRIDDSMSVIQFEIQPMHRDALCYSGFYSWVPVFLRVAWEKHFVPRPPEWPLNDQSHMLCLVSWRELATCYIAFDDYWNALSLYCTVPRIFPRTFLVINPSHVWYSWGSWLRVLRNVINAQDSPKYTIHVHITSISTAWQCVAS